MIFITNISRKKSAWRSICSSRKLTVFAMKSKRKIFSKIFQLTSKKNLTLQISHQTILQAFQQESTRKFQECLKMRLEGKSLKSLLACGRSYTQSRNLIAKKKISVRGQEKCHKKQNFFQWLQRRLVLWKRSVEDDECHSKSSTQSLHRTSE